MSWFDNLIFANEKESSSNYTPSVNGKFALNAFQSDSWNGLSNEEKKQLLKDFEWDYAQSIQLKAIPTIKEINSTNLYGGYSPKVNCITINLSKLDNPYEALDTIVHEVNHAYQCQCISEKKMYSEGERAIMHAEFQEYRNSGVEYDLQMVEMDSNNHAAEFIICQCSEKMANDPAYYEYLVSRNEHFTGLNTYIDNNLDCYQNLAQAQLLDAVSDGFISNQECIDGNIYLQTVADIKGESTCIENKVHEEVVNHAEEYSLLLHNKNEDFIYGDNSEKIALLLKNDNQTCISAMGEKSSEVNADINDLKAKQMKYVCDNNIGIEDSQNDIYFQNLNIQIQALEQRQHELQYHITELSTDNELIEQNMGWNQENLDDGLTMDENLNIEKSLNLDDGLEISDDRKMREKMEVDDGLNMCKGVALEDRYNMESSVSPAMDLI